MQKFKKIPIGLGVGHVEQEIAVAQHWNECIEQGVKPGEFIESHENIVAQLYATNTQTGFNAITKGFVEEKDGLIRLTEKTVNLCREYFTLKVQ